MKNSYGMELEGLKRSLNFLLNKAKLDIASLTTDRHSSVRKYMKSLNNIKHYFDVWHVVKGNQLKLAKNFDKA